jgi:hypothetical protein
VHHLEPALRGNSMPLVLAAVDYVHPLFREVYRNPNLVPNGVIGSPDELSESELHRRALEVAGPALKAVRQQALDRYRALQTTARVAHHVETVLPAAEKGRVEVLFAANGAQIWGHAAGPHAPCTHRVQEQGDVDLLDLAIGETIATGGTAYIIDGDAVPSREAVAAILRW